MDNLIWLFQSYSRWAYWDIFMPHLQFDLEPFQACFRSSNLVQHISHQYYTIHHSKIFFAEVVVAVEVVELLEEHHLHSLFRDIVVAIEHELDIIYASTVKAAPLVQMVEEKEPTTTFVEEETQEADLLEVVEAGNQILHKVIGDLFQVLMEFNHSLVDNFAKNHDSIQELKVEKYCYKYLELVVLPTQRTAIADLIHSLMQSSDNLTSLARKNVKKINDVRKKSC